MEKFPLNSLLTPLNRDEWLLLNENWDRIKSYLNHIQKQIKIISGGVEVDVILNNINRVIDESEQATDLALETIEEAEDLIIHLADALDASEIATNESSSVTATARALTNQMTTLKGELETLKTDLGNIRATEAARVVSENSRVTAENARANAETIRTNKESARVVSENARVTAENARANAEQTRTQTFDTKISEVNDKIEEVGELVSEFMAADYDPEAIYKFPNFVMYQGSTYLVLKNRVVGVVPTDDKVNYMLAARKGTDGQGAVNTVNNKSPESNGDVVLTAQDIEYEDGKNVREQLDDFTQHLEQSTEDLEQRGMNLKTFGAKGNKVQDDTVYLQGLINVGRDKSNIYEVVDIEVPAGNYLISSTIILPPYVHLIAKGRVKFTFTGIGALFHIYNDKNPRQDGVAQSSTNVGQVLSGNMTLQGTRRSGQIALLIGEQTLGITHVTHTAWTEFAHLYIERFDTAIKFTQVQTYIVRFDNITVSDCNTIIDDNGISAVNAGELITWFKCGFHNSNLFLRVGSEINHLFLGCSIDYNQQGVIFLNNRYNTQRFIGCWIEASETDETEAFATSLATSERSFVVFDNCHIFFRDMKGKYLCKGKMMVDFISNEVTVNRYRNLDTHTHATSSVLFDDDVIVLNCNAPMTQQNPIGISRKYHVLNRNQDFELDAVGSTTITGFTRSGANAQIVDTESFTGTKCLKISNNIDYVTLSTEMLDLNGAKFIYGQVNYKSGDAGLNILTKIEYFASDGVTLIDTFSMMQDVQPATSPTTNIWRTLLAGFVNAQTNAVKTNQFGIVPPLASKVKVTLIIGNIHEDVYIDNFFINGV